MKKDKIKTILSPSEYKKYNDLIQEGRPGLAKKYLKICCDNPGPNPLSPSFLMEKDKGIGNTDPPKEIIGSSMTTIKRVIKIVWRPNNYRRKVRVRPRNPLYNSGLQNKAIALFCTTIKRKDLNFNDHTKLLSIKNFEGVTIQYGKKTVTGIYSQRIIYGQKESFVIETDSVDSFDEWLETKKEELKGKLDNAIEMFCSKMEIEVNTEKIIWSRHEDFIKGEEYIDNLKPETIIHDTYFKKVYGAGIEFKGGENVEPIARMKNYIITRAVENLAPQIAKEINGLGIGMNTLEEAVDQFSPILKDLGYQIRVHLKVQQSTLKTQTDMRRMLGVISRRVLKEIIKKERKGTQKSLYKWVR